MKTILANQWERGREAYLWVEVGDGALLPVTAIRDDWWIVAGGRSWCCTPDTTLYVPEWTGESRRIEIVAQQSRLQCGLRELRSASGRV